ncbi:MAG: LacI family DNA-binding transcriptional regulator [Planctomycetota bacterium]|nr:LacI family DNA-binding transcriptional regulator [Planctomycetota bacterium]
MNTPATMQQVALEAGVSQATVSRVLSGKGQPFISEETRRRVMEVARKIGYESKRSIRVRPGGLILICQRRTPCAFARDVELALRDAAAQTQRDAITLFRGPSLSQWNGVSSRVLGNVDGLVAIDCDPVREDRLGEEWLRSSNVITIGARDSVAHDRIICEHAPAIVKLLEAVLDREPRSVAIVATSDAPGHLVEDLAWACQEVLSRRGVIPTHVEVPQDSRSAARRAIEGRLPGMALPCALICLTEELAIGAARAARDMKLRAPGDVSLCVCDASELSEYVSDAIIGAERPAGDVAAKSWNLLMDRIGGESLPTREISVPVEIRLGANLNANPPPVRTPT